MFFLNEIDYIISQFDNVYIFSYKGAISQYNQIAVEKNIQYKVVSDISWYSIFHLIAEVLIHKNKDIYYEIHKAWKQNGNLIIKLKRIGYLLFYVSYAFNVLKAYEKIKSDDYEDTLYSFWLSRGAYASAYLSKNYQIRKSVGRAHRFDLYENRNDINYLPFRRFIYKNIDKICFISEHGYMYFRNKYGCNSQKLLIYPLGTANQQGLKKKMWKKDFISIVSCSNIISVKRLDIIIDILSRLTIPYKWIHIGDGEMKEKVQCYAKKKLKNGSFLFMGSVKNKFIINTYMKYDIDYLINMSDSEGLPVSMMEAFSVGIPVISRNIGGVAEIVSDDSGLILDEKVNHIELITEKVQEVLKIRLEDQKKYLEMSNYAFEQWKQKFDAEKNYKRFTEMLAE